jgi:hypothetical protein
MNKKYFLGVMVLACGVLMGPHASHAAFNFTRVSHDSGATSGTGYSISPSTQPAYTTTNELQDLLTPTPYSDTLTTDSKATCDAFAAETGISSANDTYCVYDTQYICNPAFGSGDMGMWSGGSGSDASGCNIFSHTRVVASLYQVPFQTRDLATMESLLQTFALAKTMYPLGFGSAPVDPGYRDVCPMDHNDSDTFTLSGGVPDGPTPPPVCDIYHSSGVTAKPVAKLTASPTSLVTGNASSLTYSCSNEASSASINNGVGTLSSPASGTKSVSPTTTTTYTLTCTNVVGSATATASVTVYPVLAASCSVSPTSINQGGTATWTASASGGTGTYSYSWSGTDSLTGTGQTAAKSYSATGTKTASVTVTSGTQSKTVNCSNSLTVNAAPKPNLTAGAVTPTTATAGTAVTLKATVSNVTAATGAAFTDLFQRATDSSGTGATDIGTYSSAALAANGSNTASKSYTFTAGTWYVRACADKSSAGNAGVIAESNENDNCGTWTKVTVTALPPTCTLSASPADKVPSTLTWSSTNATSCTGGGFSTGNATSGTKAVSTAGNYTLSCSGSGGSCTDSVSLAAPCANPTATITADKTRIKPGDSVTLSYSGTGTDAACTVSGPGISVTSSAPNSCNVANATVDTPALSAQSTYTITCGSATDTVIINVIPGFSEF